MASGGARDDRLKALAEAAQANTNAYVLDRSDGMAKHNALSSAKTLLLELSDEGDAFFTKIEHAMAAHALRFLMSLNVHLKIPESGYIHASELAQAVGCEKELLVRMMRMVISTGVFEEAEPECYSHNRSRFLLDPGYAYFYEVIMDVFLSTLAKFPEYFQAHPLKAPSSPTSNPLSWSFGMEGSEWSSVIASNPDTLRKFCTGMNGKWSEAPVLGIYPFASELADLSDKVVEQGRVLMVDVGGAQGGTLREIREACPQLKGEMVVEDLPRVINTIPSGFLTPENNIRAVAHDFWTKQPIQNAGVYYIRRTLHNWPDEDCEILLRHLADAMAWDSKFLAAELVVPEMVQSDDPYTYWVDLTMMTFGGKQRTVDEWERLLSKAGLELVKVWRAPTGQQSVLEGRRRSTNDDKQF